MSLLSTMPATDSAADSGLLTEAPLTSEPPHWLGPRPRGSDWRMVGSLGCDWSRGTGPAAARLVKPDSESL